MLHNTIHNAAQHHTRIYRATPHRPKLRHAAQHHTIPRHTTSQRVAPRNNTTHHNTPHHTTPRQTMSYGGIPNHTTLHDLHHITSHGMSLDGTQYQTKLRCVAHCHMMPSHTTQRYCLQVSPGAYHATLHHTTPHHTT